MCGIAGELRRDGRPDVAALRRMQDAMAARGPDGDGLWSERGAGLAHRRLSIIDLSERGAQPMLDPALGLACVFNGIIYNQSRTARGARGRRPRLRLDVGYGGDPQGLRAVG